MNGIRLALIGAALCSIFTMIQPAFAQGTVFTYQGVLQDSGGPACGTYNLTFTLFPTATGGGALAGPYATNGVMVTNGLFTVQVDFGAGPWNGQTNWMELAVETNGGATLTTLAPREEVTPTPYAIFANTASNLAGALPVAQLSGTIPLAQLPTAVVTNNASGVNLIGSFAGDGTYITNVNLQNVNSDGAITWTTNYYWGNFFLDSSPTVGSIPHSVTAADVNGDGYPDLISANYAANTLTVLTNDGTGHFVLAATLPTGQSPSCVVAADVNNDGHIDLICANQQDNTLTVYTNNGTGGFVLAATPPVSSGPISLVAADVNGDGHIDLICADQYQNALTVLTNDGTGNFVLASTPSAGNEPRSVTAADVNGDGHIDLICANLFGTLTVLTNDGTGNFVLASTPTVGTPPAEPACLTAADVNGDGHVDLISANTANNTLTVLTNNGTGGFVLAATLPTGNYPLSVIATNVNGSGHVDLICANGLDNTLTILTNNGTGGFVLAATVPVGPFPYCVTAADVNRDGHVDLITANYDNSTLSVLFNTNVSFTPYFSGNGSKLTGLNFAQFNSSLPLSQLPAGVVTNNEAGVNLATVVVAGTNVVAPLTVPLDMPTAAIGSLTTGQYPLFVAVAGRYLYLVNELGNSLQIIDVSVPTNPVVVGSVGTASYANSVAVAGRYAYVTSDGGLQVIDVGDPTSPVVVGSIMGLTAPISVTIAGRYAYLANEDGEDNGTGLQIIDVGNPVNPVSVGTADTGANYLPFAATVSGRYAYVEAQNGRNLLEVFDVSNPANPVMAGSLANSGDDQGGLAVSGRYAYVAGNNGLQIVDVSNPANPTQAGSIRNENINSPTSVAVAGRYACVADYDGNLWIVDVSNPANPQTVGTLSTAGNATSVAMSGRYAYVANLYNTLQIYDLGGAYIQPLEAGSIETGTLQTRDTATVGNNLDVRGGLTVSASARISGGLAADTITATNFIGNGAGLTNLNASQLPATVVTNTETGVTLSGTFSGNGSGLTGINAANLSGTIGNAQLANNSITVYTGTGLSSGGTVPLGGSITLNNTGVTSLNSGGGVTVSASTGFVTLGSTATSANTAGAIVSRDFSGDFSAGSITLSGELGFTGAVAVGNGAASDGLNSPTITAVGNEAYYIYGNSGPVTAIGYEALQLSGSGGHSVGVGDYAMQNMWMPGEDIAIGSYALQGGPTEQFFPPIGSMPDFDTAIGYQALQNLWSGGGNTVIGAGAMVNSTNGGNNTVVGAYAMENSTNSGGNTAIGYQALYANTNAIGNIALGALAGSSLLTGSNNIDIGNTGVNGDNGIIRIGTTGTHTATYLAGTLNGNGGGLTNLPVPAPSGYAFVYDTSGGTVSAGAALPLASVGVTNGWSLNTSTSTLTVSNAGPYLVEFEGWSTSSTHNPVAVAVNGTPVTGGGTFIVANAEFYHSFITTLTANQTLQVVNLGGSSLTLSAPASGEPAFSVTITEIK